MDSQHISFVRLSESHVIRSFDCGDQDLNDFLVGDSRNYLTHLLAVTYLLETRDATIAFFSVLNDKVCIEDVDSNTKWRRYFRDLMPQGKRFRSYPAVKIGRLGVNEAFKGNGWGTMILDYIKELFLTNNRTGCKYLTVDAYKESVLFYEKNGFRYLTERDADSDTRLMYFDLAKLK